MYILSSITLIDFIKSNKLFKDYTLSIYFLVLSNRWHPAKEACHQSSCVLPTLFLSHFSCLSAPFATVASLHICLLKQSVAIAWLPKSVGPNFSLSLKKSQAQRIMSTCSNQYVYVYNLEKDMKQRGYWGWSNLQFYKSPFMSL